MNDVAEYKIDCELDDKVWAVITSDGVRAGGLTYPEASIMLAELGQIKEDRGMCIITMAAANRVLDL